MLFVRAEAVLEPQYFGKTNAARVLAEIMIAIIFVPMWEQSWPNKMMSNELYSLWECIRVRQTGG